MKEIIEKYRHVVVQIGTPYSVGTGFYLKEENLIITNEHVIRDNKEVTLDGKGFERCTSKVLFVDPLHDLAFLEANETLQQQEVLVELSEEGNLTQGDLVVAVGHPFGYEYTATQGIISNTHHMEHNIGYIQHDAALNPGNSGGPLIAESGKVVGINNFIVKDGENAGFSLPIQHLLEAIKEFRKGKGETAARCMTCSNTVFESTVKKGYCPYCGSKVTLPSEVEDYEPSGISQTVESFIKILGHDVKLCRMGPAHWMIKEGSARIKLYYNEKSGMIFGDAYLCYLPKQDISPIYHFLLKENNELEGLCFSVPENSKDIVLSLFIYDRYLNEQTGRELFFNLFKMADHYDNILIEKFGAVPKENWVDE